MQHTRSLLFFAASLLGSAVLTAPSLSDAAGVYRRWEATICYPEHATFIIGDGWGLGNNNTASAEPVRCPVEDSSDLPKSSINQIFIRGYDNSSSEAVSAMACVTNLLVPSGLCGPTASSGVATVGDYVLQPGLDEWQDPANADDYLYLRVSLPAKQIGMTASRIRGFSVTD